MSFWSQLFIPTLRESPAEAEVISHKILLRAGYIRQLSGGVYAYLPLAQRSMGPIASIVRREMAAIGAQEVHVPEGSMALAARGDLKSYKQLPQVWHQIRTRVVDEPRPRGGLLRMRQFTTAEGLSVELGEAACGKLADAWARILDQCGIPARKVQAGPGGTAFVVPASAGEDLVVRCGSCGAESTFETAAGHPVAPSIADPEGDLDPEPFHTPGFKTIADIAGFTKLPETSQMKSLVVVAGGAPVLVMVRGDHQVSETKLASILGVEEVRPASPEEIVELFGAAAGSLGPVGVTNMRVLADEALRGRRNMIAGANKDDYHLRNVTPGEDFAPEWVDVRQIAAGDTCAECGTVFEFVQAIEIGQVSKKASGMGLHVTNEAGEEVTPVVGRYSVGLERILAAAVELSADDFGMALPASIAPFSVVVTPVFMADASQRAAADRIYAGLEAEGIDTLFDDRDERPGVKFKDADLIGVPWRINLGKKLAQGLVEVVERRTKQSTDVPVDEAVAYVQSRLTTGY